MKKRVNNVDLSVMCVDIKAKYKVVKFTMIELLVVLSTITILGSVLLSALNNVKELVDERACADNIKQFGFAEVSYVNDNNGYLPTTWDMGKTWKQWADFLADDDLIPRPVNPVVGIHRCPSEDRETLPGTGTHYGQNRFGNVWGLWTRVISIQKPSETVLLYDTGITPNYDPYDYHANVLLQRNIYANRHDEGNARNYGFVDGHVKLADKHDVAAGDLIWDVD